MLDNYIELDNGIIQQINVDKIKYDVDYIDQRYNTYNDKVINMSHLRLGYIIGSIGFIPNSILDIGYGNGGFLSTCSNIIQNCYGNDVSSYSIPDGCIFIDDICKDEYDVITFFDSLEHFEDLSFINNLKCKYICISVPECHYFSDKWFDLWKHRRENEHLFHFNKTSLDKFMLENNYNNINSTNVEDIIRKGDGLSSNILTGIYKKIK